MELAFLTNYNNVKHSTIRN